MAGAAPPAGGLACSCRGRRPPPAACEAPSRGAVPLYPPCCGGSGRKGCSSSSGPASAVALLPASDQFESRLVCGAAKLMSSAAIQVFWVEEFSAS